jgi:hypothetical protein
MVEEVDSGDCLFYNTEFVFLILFNVMFPSKNKYPAEIPIDAYHCVTSSRNTFLKPVEHFCGSKKSITLCEDVKKKMYVCFSIFGAVVCNIFSLTHEMIGTGNNSF